MVKRLNERMGGQLVACMFWLIVFLTLAMMPYGGEVKPDYRGVVEDKFGEPQSCITACHK